MSAISHQKSLTMADFTGTVTVFNSQASTVTIAATDLVRPSDFNSVHNFFITISGNTAGSSTASGTNLVLAGGSFITLSMNTAAGAATISVSALPDAGYMSRYTDFGFDGNTTTIGTVTKALFRAFALLEPVSFTRVDIPVFASPANSAASNTAGAQISSALVLYTRNASTLSPIVGITSQTTHTWASNSANWSSLTGGKYLSFNVATALVPGEYFVGWQISTSTFSSGANTTSLAFNMSVSAQVAGLSQSGLFTDFGVTASISTNSYFAGMYTNSITATNQTVAMSDISVTGTSQAIANVPIIFRNI